MANDCIPYKRPGQDITAKATAAITGKTFVRVSGNRTSGPGLAATAEGSVYQMAPCGAGLRAHGVAAWDAANGEQFNVIVAGVVPVTAGAAITAGQEVEVDAAGKAIPLASGKAVGVAMSGASSGQDAEIMLALT